jgi:hypothetical protein
MKKENLIKMSLIIFIIFFSLAYFIESNLKKEIKDIEEINDKHIGKKISVYGNIQEQKIIKENLILIIKNKNQSINGIIFNRNKNINNEKNLIITGRVGLYKKELQLIIEKIDSIKP